MGPRTFRRLSAFLLLSLLLNGIGAHWIALQAFAWTRMTVERLGTDGLARSFERAVSGRSPCTMCLTARRGRENSNPPPASEGHSGVRLAYQDRPAPAPLDLSASLVTEPPPVRFLSRSLPPLLPPPRAAQA